MLVLILQNLIIGPLNPINGVATEVHTLQTCETSVEPLKAELKTSQSGLNQFSSIQQLVREYRHLLW